MKKMINENSYIAIWIAAILGSANAFAAGELSDDAIIRGRQNQILELRKAQAAFDFKRIEGKTFECSSRKVYGNVDMRFELVLENNEVFRLQAECIRTEQREVQVCLKANKSGKCKQYGSTLKSYCVETGQKKVFVGYSTSDGLKWSYSLNQTVALRSLWTGYRSEEMSYEKRRSVPQEETVSVTVDLFPKTLLNGKVQLMGEEHMAKARPFYYGPDAASSTWQGDGTPHVVLASVLDARRFAVGYLDCKEK